MTNEKISESKGKKADKKRKRNGRTFLRFFCCCCFSAALAAKLRKSASLSLPVPVAIQFHFFIVRSVSGRYRERGTGKRQHPIAAGNPVPASKAGSHRHRQGERAGILFQRAKGSTGTWEVENPSSNTVIMQCEIVLDGETVAKSAPIYPGQHIDGLTLFQPISTGSYSVTAAIKYYNKTTKAYLGMADYKIHLSVS